MEFEMELLLKSLETIGECKNYFCTIFSYKKIESNFLKNRAEIIEYKINKNLKYPWWTSPRWNVVPKGDILIGLDSDIIILKPIKVFLEETLKNKILGVIAERSPFETESHEKWSYLFKLCGLNKPEFIYKHKIKEVTCPYYINNGVVVMPIEYKEKIQAATEIAIKNVKEEIKENYFFPQIITTLAIQISKIPYDTMSNNYNTLESIPPNEPQDSINSETVFYHYNRSKDYNSINEFILDHSKLNFLKNALQKKIIL